MAKGDKDKYTDKQKRKAEHIEESYEDRGVSEKEAEKRAWATVNKESGGGNKSGSGRGQRDTHESSRKGGRKSGSGESSKKRSEAAKKGWETRRKNGNRGTNMMTIGWHLPRDEREQLLAHFRRCGPISSPIALRSKLKHRRTRRYPKRGSAPLSVT